MFGSKIKQNLGHKFYKLSYYYNLKHTKIFNASVRIISRKQFSGLASLRCIIFNFFGGPSHQIETSLLICSVNQWTGFYKIGTSVTKNTVSAPIAILID